MSEIEQLRKDIEQAKEIMLRFYRQDRQALGLGEMFERLAKLEAEAAEKADPWREHKEVLSGRFHTQQGADHDEKLVLNYAMHLQQTNEKMVLKSRLDNARIAELKAELAKRPVADPEPKVWGGKANGRWVVDSFGKPIVYYSREEAKYVFSDAVEIVPYTGEQS